MTAVRRQFDEKDPGRCQHQRIHLESSPVQRDELEVHPGTGGFDTGDALTNDLQCRILGMPAVEFGELNPLLVIHHDPNPPAAAPGWGVVHTLLMKPSLESDGKR